MFKNRGVWVGLGLTLASLGVLLFTIYGDSEEAVPEATGSVSQEASEKVIEPVETDNAIFYEDITYVDIAPQARHELDIYVPKDAEGELPLLIWIHGGAWVQGDKADPPVIDIVDDGFVLASINYRLSPDNLHPSQVEDVKAAVRFLRAHADEYNIDPNRVGLIGHSAGAHLAAFAGLSDGQSDSEDLTQGHANTSSTVQAIISSAPPIDFTTIIEDAKKVGLTELSLIPGSPSSLDEVMPEILLTGCTIAQCPKEVDATNPINDIDANDPPTFIQHSRDDDVVPYLQGEQLHDALLNENVAADINIINGIGHTFSFTDEMRAWIIEQLGS